jgi:hypothetical protein
LLWVKRGLPSLHPFNQLFDSFKGGLICEPRRQDTVMLDLLVDLNTLLTHSLVPHLRVLAFTMVFWHALRDGDAPDDSARPSMSRTST